MANKELVERCLAAGEEERLRIASAMGFPHTSRDMQAVIDEGVIKARRRMGELTEQELEELSAGQGVVEVVVPVVVLQVLSPGMAIRDPLKLDLN